jgi:Uma2 family endonuclease
MSSTLSPLPGRHRWNQEEFYKIAALGLFAPDAHLELIDGTILMNEESMNTPHATGVTLASDTLRELLPKGFHIRVQLPLAVSSVNEPLPDIVIVPGTARDYLEQHPITAPFVLEIADSTLEYDQNVKTGLYASAGVPEYAILDIPARRLHVYHKPRAVEGTEIGYEYEERTDYDGNSRFSLLEFPDMTFTVGDILP